jgi:TonB family protein
MMAHTLAMRATSLVASAGVLGVAVLVALSATYVVQQLTPPDDTPIIDMAPPEPPPPPEPVVRNPTPPLQTEVIDTQVTAIQTINTSAEPTTSAFAFSPPGPMTIENPHWLQRPRNLARYYPRRALAREVEGFVMLDCAVSTAGLLSCSVISETPSGWEFGAAALRMAADHRMQPAMRDGVPVEGRYRMRVPFEVN